MRFDFRDAFISAFEKVPENFLWSDDGVLRTSAMSAYIYPAIAARMGLYLVYELSAVDCALFPKEAVKKQLSEYRGYPPLREATILIEHENSHNLSKHEMEQLAKNMAPLNVLITYKRGSVSKQIFWAKKCFSHILSNVKDSSLRFVVVLPGEENDPEINNSESSRKAQHTGWWNFLEWDGLEFRRLKVAEPLHPS